MCNTHYQILSDEDFAKIKELQMQKKLLPALGVDKYAAKVCVCVIACCVCLIYTFDVCTCEPNLLLTSSLKRMRWTPQPFCQSASVAKWYCATCLVH